MKLKSSILAILFCFFIGEAVAAEVEDTPEANAMESSLPVKVYNSNGGSVRKKGEKKKTRDGELPRQTTSGAGSSLVTAFDSSYADDNKSNNNSSNSSSNNKPSPEKETASHTTNSNGKMNPSLAYSEAIIATASPLLGCKYVYGSKGPKTFDCSGFTSYVYREATGMTIAVNSAGQSKGGYAVSNNDLRPGDLVFFTGQNATASTSSTVGHVGIVIESEGPSDFWFMHASSSRGVTVDHITQSEYFRIRYLWARRMF